MDFKEELGRHKGRGEEKGVLIVMMNVSAFVIFCGSVESVVVELAFMCKLQEILWYRFQGFGSLSSFEMCWVVSCRSMIDLVKDYMVDVWELKL